MASPRHLLRIIAQYNLDPTKAYLPQHVQNNGHITARIGHPVLKEQEPAKADAPAPVKKEDVKVEKTEAKTQPSGDKKPAAESAPKAEKPAEVKAEATPKATGETVSVEQPKEEKPAADVGSKPADGKSS